MGLKNKRDKIRELEQKTMQIKHAVLDVFENGHSGHIASSYSCAELLTALFYGDVMRFDPAAPKWDDRDRFLMSKGHAGIIYYTILADLGYFPKSELDKFAQADGKIGVHVHTSVPGVEANSGSLASGFGVAVGMALAAKLDLKNHLVFALLGDGECYEGAVWESAHCASGKHLNNLVVIVDHNHMCCSGFIADNLPMEPLDKKWEAFGFDVVNINGHDFEQIMKAFSGIRCRKSDRPLCIIADTVKAHGLASVENTPLCHGFAPVKPEAMERTRRELDYGWGDA